MKKLLGEVLSWALTLAIIGVFGVGFYMILSSGPDQDELQRFTTYSVDEREDLSKKKQRFIQLSEPQQDRLRQFHEELEARSDREALLKTLDAYNNWLSTLQPAERARILDTPVSLRIQEIEKGQQPDQATTERPNPNGAPRRPSAENLLKWWRSTAEKNIDELISIQKGNEQPKVKRQNDYIGTLLKKGNAPDWALVYGFVHAKPVELHSYLEKHQSLENASGFLEFRGNPISDEIPIAVRMQRWQVAFSWACFFRVGTTFDVEEYFSNMMTEEEQAKLDGLSPKDRDNAIRLHYRDTLAFDNPAMNIGPGDRNRGGSQGGPGGRGRDEKGRPSGDGKGPPRPPESNAKSPPTSSETEPVPETKKGVEG